MSQNIVTVTALVRYLKSKLEKDAMIQGVLVEGEISNFSNYRSGHWYFSIKDTTAQIRCVMFASSNRQVKFIPKDGDKIIVRGDISIFESRGEIQMIVTGMKPTGVGDLYLQYEMLKKKLDAKGLFDPDHKKPIPSFPFRIGLVTGKDTAARADVLQTLARRWPVAKILEYPVLVQGKDSAKQIVSALKIMDTQQLDVLLLVRGGGSIEDLQSFNDEALAETIYALKTPIITGVGHEVDFTIADFVSDLRAPTPTGAAELCSPDLNQVQNGLLQSKIRLLHAVDLIQEQAERQLNQAQSSWVFKNPERITMQKQMRFNQVAKKLQSSSDQLTKRMNMDLQSARNRLASTTNQVIIRNQITLHEKSIELTHLVAQKQKQSENQVQKAASLLDAYSPLKVLQRGYSAVMREGKAVKRYNEVSVQDEVHVLLGEGSFDAVVTKINKGE